MNIDIISILEQRINDMCNQHYKLTIQYRKSIKNNKKDKNIENRLKKLIETMKYLESKLNNFVESIEDEIYEEDDILVNKNIL